MFILIFAGLALFALIALLLFAPMGLGFALASQTEDEAMANRIVAVCTGIGTGLAMGLCFGFFLQFFFISGPDDIPGVWIRLTLIGGGIGGALGLIGSFFD